MVHLSYFHGYRHLLILNTFFFSIKNGNKRETASQIALRNYSKDVREQPAFIGVFAVKKKKKSKSYCLSQQTSQVDYFSAFQCVGKFKSLGLLKLLL